ncbi:hypothetical protein SPRG_04405 [Saprolegnia parasitica CBS 223.65]|uniref:Uncharacterized protein n=1 Tax=Saprolegnia parasitica (strain CBS 223.65) TaxID=695850 RepID=A0A067CIZ2_SAPPC|nr:hypothetical protein SPRG_04405 [Saprolegnia parasitica CBS 223.65]KDO30503.1 hypothetical protein SPRG_04405 [Saprolegnia parasitica CBS 223.65]|eukprot:XP_012198720.1 hypothetical protein SPRG_04405 [Saprolegnia parasitica CBS 223.65]
MATTGPSADALNEMGSNLTFSDLLDISSGGISYNDDPFLDDPIVVEVKPPPPPSQAKSQVTRPHVLKRKPSISFQKRRSQNLDFYPRPPEDKIDMAAVNNQVEDFMQDFYSPRASKEPTTTTFVTPTAKAETIRGLGLDLSMPPVLLVPTEIPEPIPYTPLKQEEDDMEPNPIPELLPIMAPPNHGHRHMYNNSVDLSHLSSNFAQMLQQPNPGFFPGSPLAGGTPLGFPPTSPVHNPMAMGSMSPLQMGMSMAPPPMYNLYPGMMYPGGDMGHMQPPMPASPALSSGLSSTFEAVNIRSVPNSPSSSTADGSERREKREYKCRQCGQPKSGHICTSIKSMMDSSCQSETSSSNTNEWRILTVKSKWVAQHPGHDA